jgi:spore germination cell wall hydrolase CwlJ-like protein
MNRIVCALLAGMLSFAPFGYNEVVKNEPTTEPLKVDIPSEPIAPIDIPIEIEEAVVEERKEVATIEVNPEPKVDPASKELLACVIYQEAGSDLQCDDCRRRVADVVLNRVENELFPNTIYEVLTQQYQYGLYYYTGVTWPERASDPTEAEAVNRAYRIAEEVLSGQHSDIYGKEYVWQAEFTQGTNVIYCCETYFGQLVKEG